MNDSIPNSPARPKWVGLLTLVLLVVGLASLALVIAAAVKGDSFAIGNFLWVKPTRYLRLAAIGLGGAWVLSNFGRPGAMGKAFGKLVMLAISAALSIAVAEIGMRVILSKQMAAGSFERFKEMKKRGEKIKVKSASPLAAIITPSDNPGMVYELTPDLTMEFGHRTLHINSQGFRSDQIFAKERAPNSIRILGLGDSGIFGWGVNQGSNYLDVATRILNARGDGVTYEALNTGTPGYNTRMEVELLKDRGLAFKPDIVVVGWCENDFDLPFFFYRQAPLPKDHLLVQDFVFNREKFRHELAGPSISDRSNAANQQGKVDFGEIPESLRKGLGVPGVTAAMAELKELGAKHGFEVLIFGPMRKSTPEHPEIPDVEKIVKQVGLEYVDTYAKVDASKYPAEYAVHFMHPRDGGHYVLGELLVKELDERGWLKPSK